MSRVGLDQILQISNPASPRQSSSNDAADGDNFRSILNRATEVADTRTQQATEESESRPPAEDESLAIDSGEQGNTTPDNEVATDNEDGDQSTAEQLDEEVPANEENSKDEVILSSTAVVAITDETADLPAQVFVAADSQQINQGNPTSGQDQPAQDQTQQQSQLVQNSTLDTLTQVETTQAVEPTTTSTEEQTANQNQQAVVDTPLASNEASPQSAGEFVTTSTANENQPLQQAQTTGSQLRQSLAAAVTNEENTAPSDSDESTNSRSGESRPASPAISLNDLAIVNEAEPAAQGLQSSSETSPTTVTNSPTLPTSELIASAEGAASRHASTQVQESNQTNATQSSQETPTVDRSRFVQRVSGAIRSAQQRDGQIQLRLSPPELGTLRIQLTVNEGAITANLETETNAARTILLDNLPALRERLAEQGITIEKFDVDVGREGQQQTDNSADGERESNQSSNDSDSNPETQEQESTATTTVTPITQNISTESGLDIEV